MSCLKPWTMEVFKKNLCNSNTCISGSSLFAIQLDIRKLCIKIFPLLNTFSELCFRRLARHNHFLLSHTKHNGFTSVLAYAWSIRLNSSTPAQPNSSLHQEFQVIQITLTGHCSLTNASSLSVPVRSFGSLLRFETLQFLAQIHTAVFVSPHSSLGCCHNHQRSTDAFQDENLCHYWYNLICKPFCRR